MFDIKSTLVKEQSLIQNNIHCTNAQVNCLTIISLGTCNLFISTLRTDQHSGHQSECGKNGMSYVLVRFSHYTRQSDYEMFRLRIGLYTLNRRQCNDSSENLYVCTWPQFTSVLSLLSLVGE